MIVHLPSQVQRIIVPDQSLAVLDVDATRGVGLVTEVLISHLSGILT